MIDAPHGQFPPNRTTSAVLAMTRRLPNTRLGLKLSMPLRRLALNTFGDAPVDAIVWGARVRLHPWRNICEKNALFTPQMYDTVELAALRASIEESHARKAPFHFIDIGANIGLYSMFVAQHAAAGDRILAFEPQPIIVDRLRFNVKTNALPIEVLQLAVADITGEIEFVINTKDSGGSHVRKAGYRPDGRPSVRVQCRPLLSVLRDASISSIDALKIDIEGAEDVALAPFLRDAPDSVLPRLLIIEISPSRWSIDLFGMLQDRGFSRAGGTACNAILRRDQ